MEGFETLFARIFHDWSPRFGHCLLEPCRVDVAYLRWAIAVSPSDLVFPAADGKMLNKRTQLELVLRRAMRRANLVTGYVHKCRRKGCRYREPTADANPRRC